MPKIKSIENIEKDIHCISCSLQSGEIKRIGGVISETKYFDLQQDYEIPIPGFIVIASKRHIVGFADFNKKERIEFINFICETRKAMKEVLNIKYIQILFKEETIESKVNPSHFHIALLPKYEWMKDFPDVLSILKYARKNMKTEENIKEVKKAARKLKKYLSKN